MSDSEHSTVTYTSVSILVEDDSDIGSPRIDGPPIMPEDPYSYIMAAYQVPPSPDYIPGPEVPPSPDYIPGLEEPQSPLPLDFVPEPMYPEYIPQEDEILPAKEQPLPAAASPTTDSPGYVPESDPKEEPEEDDEDPEEDPADYPADRDDDDDKDEDEDEDEEEEEEHPALADSVPPIPSPTITYTITTANHSPTHIEIPESCLPLRKRVHFASPTPSHEVGESSAAVHPMSRELDYGITDTWDDLVGAIDEIAPTTLEGVNQRVTDLSTIVEQETTIMYGIGGSVIAVNDTREAIAACKAWRLSMDASDYACSDVMSLRTTVVAQSALISELQSADHRRQRVISELLASDHKRQLADCIDLLFCLATQYRSFVQAMINEGITAALAARDATWNGNDSHTSGTGVRRPVQVARKCTYPDFLKCQPLNFKGTEGVVKFATCTLQGNALTWWNSYVKTTTPEAAHAMPWRTLKKMMIDKYCPRGEIKKLEFKMWNLKVRGNDVVTYSQRFQELALMCDRMFLEEINEVEKYVGGLPDTIHGSGYQQKDRKPSQNDKTEHGMEKTVQNQGQSPKWQRSRVNTEESAVKPRARTEEYLLGMNLNPSDGGKPNSIIMKTVKTKWALNQLQQPICVQLTKTVKTLKAQS
ncbi:reverse transcriptase domain-containing protein [Tanacetum coccineum]